MTAVDTPRVIGIDRALLDKRLLGAALGDAASWATWLVVLRASFGLKLTPEQQKIFAQVAGNRSAPTKRVRELWAIVGRRGGKSRMAAALAIFIALFVPHKLSPGERGMVLVLAMSKEQARVVFSYALAFLRQSPALCKEIADTTASEIRLKNGIVIAIHSTSFRSLRGRTLCACVLDEVAFWRDELSAAPDTEVYSALLPSLLTTGGVMVGISTGYRRAGLMYQKHRDFFGQDSDDTLVVQGSTQTFNGTIDEAALAALRAADPAAAPSEWNGTFRDDVGAFLDDELIDAAVDHGRPLELPPQTGVEYLAVTDSSGGRGDAYTFAIGHKNGDQFVIDALRGTHPPFDPVETTKQYAALAKEYRIAEVTRDHYAAEWVSAAWRDCGIRCERSELTKSAIYIETLPLFARGVVRLPDHPKLLRELRLLERFTHRSGKDTISHGKTGSDDYANAALGVLRLLAISGPALWRASSFTTTTPATPIRADLIFATLVVGDAGQAGVAYFAKSIIPGSPLTILDVDLAPLSPNLLLDMAARLTDFVTAMRARGMTIFAQSPVAAELERLGVRNIEPLDYVLSDPLLSVAASVHVSGHRVQLCAEVLAKDFPLGFLHGAATPTDDDPLSLAVIAGICVALDDNRTLRRPKPRAA